MTRPRVARATIELDRNGLQVLDRAACLDLLVTARIDRLAFMSEGSPRIIPLSVALEDEAVLFRLPTDHVEGRRLLRPPT